MSAGYIIGVYNDGLKVDRCIVSGKGDVEAQGGHFSGLKEVVFEATDGVKTLVSVVEERRPSKHIDTAVQLPGANHGRYYYIGKFDFSKLADGPITITATFVPNEGVPRVDFWTMHNDSGGNLAQVMGWGEPKTVYLDPVNGIDTNDGTKALPVKSLKAASELIRLAPNGSRIVAMGDIQLENRIRSIENDVWATIDLQGHTMSVSPDFAEYPGWNFKIKWIAIENGKVQMSGYGSFKNRTWVNKSEVLNCRRALQTGTIGFATNAAFRGASSGPSNFHLVRNVIGTEQTVDFIQNPSAVIAVKIRNFLGESTTAHSDLIQFVDASVNTVIEGVDAESDSSQGFFMNNVPTSIGGNGLHENVFVANLLFTQTADVNEPPWSSMSLPGCNTVMAHCEIRNQALALRPNDEFKEYKPDGSLFTGCVFGRVIGDKRYATAKGNRYLNDGPIESDMNPDPEGCLEVVVEGDLYGNPRKIGDPLGPIATPRTREEAMMVYNNGIRETIERLLTK